MSPEYKTMIVTCTSPDYLEPLQQLPHPGGLGMPVMLDLLLMSILASITLTGLILQLQQLSMLQHSELHACLPQVSIGNAAWTGSSCVVID